jgi:hypothetical protein
MSLRKIVALAVVAVWIGALGWQAKRLYLRPEAARIAEAARTLPPGVAYYALYRGERPVGWAQSEIDTLPSGGGFVVDERLQVDVAGAAAGTPMAGQVGEGTATVRSEATLGPALALRDFRVSASGVMGGFAARGAMEGDSVLEIRVEREGEEQVRRIPMEERIVLETTLPLRIAAEGDVEPGDRIRVRTFDPVRMRTVSRTVDILEREVRTFPDSATREGEDGDWAPARRDTVRAWKIRREVAGFPLEAWVDEDGRYLEISTPVGVRLERTAFELAYYGWRGGETP